MTMELKFHNDVVDFSELTNTEITVAVDDEGLYNTSRINSGELLKVDHSSMRWEGEKS